MTKGIIKVKADKLNKPKKQERESDFFFISTAGTRRK